MCAASFLVAITFTGEMATCAGLTRRASGYGSSAWFSGELRHHAR
jgi:hypothetical protein